MERSAVREIEAPDDGSSAPARQPEWRTDALWNAAIVLIGFGVYTLSYAVFRALYPGSAWRRQALANAQRIAALERSLHLLGEAQVQTLLSRSDALTRALNVVYLWFHIPLIIVVAVWLFVRNRRQYRLTRNAFLIAGGVALLCELWPVAPPYLLPSLHIANTAATTAGGDLAEPKLFFNYYGAIPSIHVAWAILLALAVLQSTRSLLVRLLAVAWPVLMAVAVVATGNHYLFDVATGALTAIVSLWLGKALLDRWERRRALAPAASLAKR